MKKRTGYYAALITILLWVASVQAQHLTIQTEDGKQTVLERADIAALPHSKITTGSGSDSVAYDVVPLQALLEHVGVQFGESLRGKGMASCLVVEAADNYRVVIALPELDSAFTTKQVLLAFMRDGKPLDDREGPYRIIIPDEKRMARWVRQVTTLKIVAVQ